MIWHKNENITRTQRKRDGMTTNNNQDLVNQQVTNNSVSLKTVRGLKNYHFEIPSMQRGYRWTEKDITALLNDLSDFDNDTNNPIYCLQPLVLKKKKYDQRKNVFSVIDGQQRLTTLFIFLTAVADTEEDKEKLWTFEYDKKPEETIWMKSLSESSPVDSLDQLCKREAWQIISNYDESKKKIIKKLLTNDKDSKHIGFIWYELHDDENGNEVFRRLNSGKIDLTVSELIKALYMVDGNELTLMEKMEIAKEWELIESRLRDDSFWYTFNSTKPKTYTRIDTIFNLIAGDENPDDPLNCFYRIESECKKAKDLRKYWEQVILIFEWMKSIEQDRITSQFMGYIRLFTDTQMTTLCPLFKTGKPVDIISQRKFLWKVIQNLNIIPYDFSSVNYEWNKKHLRKFFVLFNIVLLITNKDDERFPFSRYLNEKGWDIEHINSNTVNDMTKPLDQIEWVLESWKELYHKDNKADWIKVQRWLSSCKNDHISQTLKRMKKDKTEFTILHQSCDQNEPVHKTAKLIFSDVTNIIRNLAKENEENDNKDALGNLTLLDESTNRSYGNAIFPVKRRRIRERIKAGQFVPPATKLVFMKYFTTTPTSVTSWQLGDKNAYFHAIEEIFNNIIQEMGE
jgi:uncharacterized protein with ParB-like and HNH nuclease domain